MPDWQEILSREGPAAWQTAFRLLGNHADADECFQEACLAALRFRGVRMFENWRGLLQRLATSRSVDRLRLRYRQRQRRSGSLADCPEPRDDSPSPLQNAEEVELAEKLREVLGQLPPKQAQAFCLHCIEDWSYQDIARQMAVSIDAVGVLMHRARKRLHELLAAFSESRPASLRKEHS